ncbi:hypothetical+protein [Methylocapsa aurea]
MFVRGWSPPAFKGSTAVNLSRYKLTLYIDSLGAKAMLKADMPFL